MATAGLHPVALKQGLDLVTPPMLAEPGSLIDCLNYEMTDVAGYRKIDGYEKYDGYPNGLVYEFYRVHIDAITPTDQPLIVPGLTLSRVTTNGPVDMGVIVGGPLTGNMYDIVPRDSLDAFITDEDFLLNSDGGFLTLVSELGNLKLIGDDATLGSDFIVTTFDGTVIPIEVAGVPVTGKNFYDPVNYLNAIRTYGAVLRGLVQDAPSPIAGLYWYDDRLLVAVNSLSISLSIASGGTPPSTGVRMRWNGNVYRTIVVNKVASGVNDIYDMAFYPIGTDPNVDDNLVQVDNTGVPVSTWITGVTANGNPSYDNSEYAALGYFNNPYTSPSRGFTFLTPSYSFAYDSGNYTAGAGVPPNITMDSNVLSPSDPYYVVGSDGMVLKVRLTALTEDGGSFTGGTATGRAEVSIISSVAGTREYVRDNDEIHNAYPTTVDSRVLTVNGSLTSTLLAGTGALDREGTKYQWGTFNFYGQSSTLTAYGVTGASRAFWANKYSYGSIITQTDATKDYPKYVSFHSSRLALGFRAGSLLLSASGVPYNFNGVDGAMEIATGDDITGLLELPGDTLAIFGRRTIRKVTGDTPDNIALGTISGNAGAFDYTACLVGSDAVFTNNNGVATLQQTAAYGDFIGKSVSDKIGAWLRPKLGRTGLNFEDGGVIMAYIVRAKGQYRLVLKTGEVISFNMVGETPTVMFSNYGLAGERKIPYALASEVSDNGQERIHTVWDNDTLHESSVYELESGWGFNGVSFRSYFDLVPLFDTGSATNWGVEKVRMYGLSYGVATLDVKTAGIEEDFNQSYHTQVQDISMPKNPDLLYTRQTPVTGIVDEASWGLGIKLRIEGSIPESSTETEPSHTCQVLILHSRTEGADD